MKSSFYFKHDLDAREDDKMRAMLIKHGAAGYGIYWMVVEDLYRNKGRLVRDYKALSWAYHQPQPKIKSVIEDFSAFYDSKGKIACRRVDRGLWELNEFREQARRAGRQGGLKRALNAGQGSLKGRLEKSKQRDETKGEENKERETGAGLPSLFEIQEYVKTTGSAVDPERFFNINSARGWVVSGAPVVDWKALMASWEKTERPSPVKEAEKSKNLKCRNRSGCGLSANWIVGNGKDGTPLCAYCLEQEAVAAESNR